MNFRLMNIINVIVVTLLFGSAESVQSAEKPVKLIYDTDMGNDIDDALALGVIHSLQSRKECELLAVTVSKDHPYAARYCDAINTFYGRGDIPVGIVKGGKTPKAGKFLPVVELKDNGQQRFPHDIQGTEDTPAGFKLLRQILAGQEDHSVTVAVVGFSTNLSRLLDSEPDEFSPLNGRELVEKKVVLLSMMAGHFGSPRPEKFKEYNVIKDLPAARNVFDNWPSPIVTSGWEVGHAIKFPAVSIQNDFNYVEFHPLKEGYIRYQKMPYDRPNWDLTSILYAIRPDRDYFGLSAPGVISIGSDDFAVFKADVSRQHRYLTVTPAQIERVGEALIQLASQPPE